MHDFTPDPLLVRCGKQRQLGASDLHITAGDRPRARRDGTLSSSERQALEPEYTQRMVFTRLPDRHGLRRDLAGRLSLGLHGSGASAQRLHQRHACALALRVVPFRLRTLEELGARICRPAPHPYACVLVVGPPSGRRRWRR